MSSSLPTGSCSKAADPSQISGLNKEMLRKHQHKPSPDRRTSEPGLVNAHTPLARSAPFACMFLKDISPAAECMWSKTELFFPQRMKSRLPGQGQRATSAAPPRPPPGPPVWIRGGLKPRLPSLHAALQGLAPPELPSSLPLTLKLSISAAPSG